jgi:hypothetical protein
LQYRGLGITDLKQFGRALRLRWLWCQWKHPDKPWCNSELPIDSTDEALFAAATRVTIHNGSTPKFWTSNWSHGVPLASMFPAMFEHSRRNNRTVAEAMTNDAWVLRDLMHDTSTSLPADYVLLNLDSGGRCRF